MRWRVGERLGLLGRKLQTPADRPGGGEVGDERENPPTGSLRSRRLRRRLRAFVVRKQTTAAAQNYKALVREVTLSVGYDGGRTLELEPLST